MRKRNLLRKGVCKSSMKSRLGLGMLLLLFVMMTGCNSKGDKPIPIELEFEGEISQYYSVQNAVVKFEKTSSSPTRYKTTIELDLVRNNTPFALEPSNYEYLGSAVVGFGSSPKSGAWCMFVDIQNSQHDKVGTCCGCASKLFEYYKSSGEVCHLTFDTSVDDIWRKGTTDDVKDFLEGKQKFFFYLKGLLNETEKKSEVINEASAKEISSVIIDNENSKSKYVVINATDLRLRYAPSMDAETYKQSDGKNAHPNKGESFNYLGEEGDFYNIDYHGNKLWVSKQYTYLSESNTGKVDDQNYEEEITDSNSSSNVSYYHFNKANKFYNIEWYDSAFEEFNEGMKKGETSCAFGVAWCYLNERGTPKNIKKAVSILEQYAEKDVAICLFVALFYDPNPTSTMGNVNWGWEYHPTGEVIPIESVGYGIRGIYGFPPVSASKFGLSHNLSKAIKYAEKVNKKLKTSGSAAYLNSLKNYEVEKKQ